MISCLKGKTHDKDEGNSQTFFTKNGGVLLKQLVAFSNGRPNPICHFSAKELLIATNYYDTRQIVVQDDGYQLYKGYLKDFPIFVKKYDNVSRLGILAVDPYKDIAIGSQMSAHKNVSKVLACCLETEIPTIVYEYAAGTKTLSSCISATNVESLPWKFRLKIALDIANAIAYLPNAFHRPIIHRDIKCSNIILDENNIPKLIDFGLCISIPEGQSHVASSTLDRMEFPMRSDISEKFDVSCFGMLLVNLFTGKIRYDILYGEQQWIENFSSIVDPRIKGEGIEAQQMVDFVKLFSRCRCDNEKKRPTMIEVAKELRRIHQSF